jgi:hypothetical protein
MSTTKKFLASLALVLIIGAGMLYTESKAGGESGIIVKLELAGNIEEVKYLLEPFTEQQIEWLRQNTRLDFIFILVYTSLFYFALKGLAERVGIKNSWKWVLWLAFIPGILDVVENLFILNFLDHQFNTPYYNIYYWAVHAKWSLVGGLVLLSIIYLAMLTISIILGKKLLLK